MGRCQSVNGRGGVADGLVSDSVFSSVYFFTLSAPWCTPSTSNKKDHKAISILEKKKGQWGL